MANSKALNWLLTTPAGNSTLGLPVLFLLCLPAYWWGWLWVAPVLGLGIGFVAGWAAARRYWRRDGYVPKL